MAIAQDYAALDRLGRRSGQVMVLCTGYVYRWRLGRWLFVRAGTPRITASKMGL